MGDLVWPSWRWFIGKMMKKTMGNLRQWLEKLRNCFDHDTHGGATSTSVSGSARKAGIQQPQSSSPMLSCYWDGWGSALVQPTNSSSNWTERLLIPPPPHPSSAFTEILLVRQYRWWYSPANSVKFKQLNANFRGLSNQPQHPLTRMVELY